MNTEGLRFPKPEPRSRVKGRKDRQEAKVKKSVRAQCVDRDGRCRLAREFPTVICDGPSEWAHLGDKKRARTRGQHPETRHTTAGSLMLCRAHHREYDRGDMTILIHDQKGADGALSFLFYTCAFYERYDGVTPAWIDGTVAASPVTEQAQ